MIEIPDFLAHRPVAHGMPVPYVAIWSDEKDPKAARLVKWRKIDWIYVEHPTGEPDFGATNSHRQRDCMLHCRCQICGKDGADLYVIPNDSDTAGTHVGLWDEDGMILNAPLHEACYEFSHTICPHLRTTEPHHVVRYPKPLNVVAYTTRTFALPIHVVLAGTHGRELIVKP